MEPKTRLENWLTLRPALIHIWAGPVQPRWRDITIAEGANHFAWLIEKGEVSVSRAGRTVSASSGQWMLATPAARSQRFSPDARIISLHYQMKWPDGCNLFEDGLSLVLPASNYPRLEVEARRILQATKGVLPSNPVRIRRTPISVRQYFRMQHLGMGFLSALIEVLIERGLAPARAGETDDRLLDVQRQLDQWPVNRPLSDGLETLMRGWARDTLERRFRKVFGVTPAQYLENRRRGYARRLLGHSRIPIKEIAGNLGFRALADFSSWFKRAHGTPPREYRRAAIASGNA